MNIRDIKAAAERMGLGLQTEVVIEIQGYEFPVQQVEVRLAGDDKSTRLVLTLDAQPVVYDTPPGWVTEGVTE